MSEKLEIYQAQYGIAFFHNGILIGYVHENDGTWRDEYFNPILSKLGISVVAKKSLTEKQKQELAVYEDGGT